MFKSNKGFTLVELIVVIAILAILAGVAIPVYNGYIKRAQDAAVVTELDAIQTAAQAANATSGQINVIVVDGSNIYVGGANNVLAANFNSDFVLFYPDATASANLGQLSATIDLGNATYKDGATWKNGEWKAGTETVPAQEAGSSLGNNGGAEKEEEKEDDAAHKHTYNAVVTKEATCKTAGTKTYTCTDTTCNHTYTEEIAKTGHNWVTKDGIEVCDNEGCGIKKTDYEAGIY